MTVCLGTQVPEGYVISRYQSSSACGFIPGIPGVELLLLNVEDQNEFTACSASPYPEGYVITKNYFTEDCKLNTSSPGLAHVFQSINSLEASGSPDYTGFYACSNSQHPPGYFIMGRGKEDECSIDSNDLTLQVYYYKTTESEIHVCAGGPRPPKEYVVVGKYPESCGAMRVDGINEFNLVNLSHKYIYRKPQGEPVIRVCMGLDSTAPAGYIFTGMEEDEACQPDTTAPYEPEYYSREVDQKGYAHIYKLPFYALLP